MSEIEPTRLQARPRTTRRRRTGTGRVTVELAQLPADAAGRVELIILRTPADVLEPVEPQPPPVVRPVSRVLARLMSYDGWIAATVLAVALASLFIIGLWFTH